VALMIEVADRQQESHGGGLAADFDQESRHAATPGAVSYMFHRKGQITVPVAAIAEDKLVELVIEAGGDEFEQRRRTPRGLDSARPALRGGGDAEHSRRPSRCAEAHVVPETQVQVGDEHLAAQGCG